MENQQSNRKVSLDGFVLLQFRYNLPCQSTYSPLPKCWRSRFWCCAGAELAKTGFRNLIIRIHDSLGICRLELTGTVKGAYWHVIYDQCFPPTVQRKTISTMTVGINLSDDDWQTQSLEPGHSFVQINMSSLALIIYWETRLAVHYVLHFWHWLNYASSQFAAYGRSLYFFFRLMTDDDNLVSLSGTHKYELVPNTFAVMCPFALLCNFLRPHSGHFSYLPNTSKLST